MVSFVRLFFFFVFNAVPFVETINPAVGCRELLFSGKERMTIGASINTDIFRRGAGNKCISAGSASDSHLIVLRMNTFFHVFFLLLP